MPAVKLLDTNIRQRLDRYELVGELASGGMATVFLGRIGGVGGFQRFVAIKRLHPHLAHEQEFVEMFIDEARLAASIHHPNVVPILDIGASEQGYYLVMEYIEGDTLARLLARAAQSGERLPMPIALRILLDTLAGLHAAHELRDENDAPLGLVHRDVSPQNLLVGVDGTSRITDFGVAHASSRLGSTRAGQLKGKLAYMAPEQARGQAVDRRADIFAMGTVLWEVLAGRRLFKADGDAETLNRVLFEPIPRLRDVDPSAPAALDAVAARALERDPDKRFANCAELADAVERAARATRLMASARDVAEYVQRVIGQDVQQQREAVRTWLAASEPSRMNVSDLTGPPSFLSPAASETTRTASSVTSTAITIRHREARAEAALASATLEVPATKASRAALLVAGGIAAGVVLAAAAALWMGRGTSSAAVASTDAPPATNSTTEASPASPRPSDPSALPKPAASVEPSRPTAGQPSADVAVSPSAEPAPLSRSDSEAIEVVPSSTPTRAGASKKTPAPKPTRPSAVLSEDDDIVGNPYR